MKTTKTLIALAALAASLTALTLPAVSDARPIQRHPVERSYNDNRSDMRGHNDWNRHGDNDRSRRNDRGTAQLSDRISNLQSRISMGRRSGELSMREASRLNGELDRISWQTRNAERSGRGLNGREYSDLSARLDNLSAQVFGNRHDHNRR